MGKVEARPMAYPLQGHAVWCDARKAMRPCATGRNRPAAVPLALGRRGVILLEDGPTSRTGGWSGRHGPASPRRLKAPTRSPPRRAGRRRRKPCAQPTLRVPSGST